VQDALSFSTTRRGVGRSVALLVARNRVALRTVGLRGHTLSSCTVRYLQYFVQLDLRITIRPITIVWPKRYGQWEPSLFVWES